MVFADVLKRADQRAGDLAADADQSRSRGVTFEQAYDGVVRSSTSRLDRPRPLRRHLQLLLSLQASVIEGDIQAFQIPGIQGAQHFQGFAKAHGATAGDHHRLQAG